MNDRPQISKQDLGHSDVTLPPAVDVIEDETGITVLADLPGVPKEKLSVKAEGDSLIIEGEVALDTPPEMEAVHVEMQIPRYRRVFTLSRDLDATRCEASFTGGTLRLRIPKAEHAQPRKIEVRVG